MKKGILLTVLVSVGMTLGACGGKDDGGGDGIASASNSNGDGQDDGAEESTGGAMDDTAGDDQMDGGSGGETAGSDGGDDGGQTEGGIFIADPDGGGISFECDLFAQDCPDGEKCMPWANDGGGAWNATRCSPVSMNPGQPGDECTVEGSGVSGIDSCDLGGMCWDVDPETNMGTCVAMCQGDEANPICEDPDTTCTIANNGAIILCLPTCHPLVQDCPDGQACYPIADEFACAPNVSGDMGNFGDACEFINVCQNGLACVNPDVFTNCPSTGCCSAFCDLTDAGADATCAGLDPGQSCVAWYVEGEEPPGYEDVGICAIPA